MANPNVPSMPSGNGDPTRRDSLTEQEKRAATILGAAAVRNMAFIGDVTDKPRGSVVVDRDSSASREPLSDEELAWRILQSGMDPLGGSRIDGRAVDAAKVVMAGDEATARDLERSIGDMLSLLRERGDK
ncbi:MAG TPA: hypothetical protein VLE99_04685 [Candidatus Saccharimonadales bacterium]|nr:hypothetical protein [Candidatus Saccharimonadales bacterium]